MNLQRIIWWHWAIWFGLLFFALLVIGLSMEDAFQMGADNAKIAEAMGWLTLFVNVCFLPVMLLIIKSYKSQAEQKVD